MAAVDWPWNLATIYLGNYGFDKDPNIRRTPFEDLAIRQEKVSTDSSDIRSFKFAVKKSDINSFRDWLDDNEDNYFNFREWHDGAVRDFRVRGGSAAVRLAMHQGNMLLDGEKFAEGDIVLESVIT